MMECHCLFFRQQLCLRRITNAEQVVLCRTCPHSHYFFWEVGDDIFDIFDHIDRDLLILGEVTYHPKIIVDLSTMFSKSHSRRCVQRDTLRSVICVPFTVVIVIIVVTGIVIAIIISVICICLCC